MKRYLSLFVAGFAVACATPKTTMNSNNIAGKTGLIATWATWTKDKGTKVDMDFHIRNDSDGFIIVLLSDLRCSRGDVPGKLRYTFFNTGERTIDLSPGQDKGANMVCSFDGQEVGGNVQVEVRNVFDNPTHDRKTPGVIIAKNIVWNQTGSVMVPATPATPDGKSAN
jgi:hypothetical protein